MISISFEQQTTIGLRYVLGLLEPCSPYGKERLRTLRPAAPGEREALQRCLDNVGRTLSARPLHEKTCARLEQLLRQMKDVRGSLRTCLDGELGEVDLFELKRFLLQLSELRPLFDQLNADAGYDGIALQDTEQALELLDPEGSRVASFHISGRYSAALTGIRRRKRDLEQQVRDCTDAAEKVALLEQRSAVAAEEHREEAVVRRKLTRQLRPFVKPLQANIEAIGELDLTLQKAALAGKRGCCRPTLTANKIRFAGLSSPQVADTLAAAGKAFTPLTLELAPGTTVLTGANMGGKSVALKAVALNVLLVHMGFYPFAREAEVPLFDAVHIVSEDLEAVDRGLSSFGGEIVRLGEITASLGQGFALVLLDEFARGTNPAEGAAIARGVAAYMDRQNAVTLMATHYDGVAQAGSAHYQVLGLRRADLDALGRDLESAPPDQRVVLIGKYMDFGLAPQAQGEPPPRDAMHICRLLGLDKSVMKFIEDSWNCS